MIMFYEKVNRMKINDVLDQLEGDNINKQMLKDRFNEFEKTYKEAVKNGLAPKYDDSRNKLPVDLQPVISQIYNYSDKSIKQWTHTQVSELPKLLAYVFALWTLNNVECYNDADDTDLNKEKYLLQPHVGQVISIFRMLGVGYSKFNLSSFFTDTKKAFSNFFGAKDIKNQSIYDNMVQIKTGEGKSITLAAVSIVFALHGFEVSCACYSDYLSRRDYEAFETMFSMLGLTEQISYGTFNQLCERYLNSNGSIRDIFMNKMLIKTKLLQRVDPHPRPKILLIDEVDIFFSKDFYGAQYRPLATIGGPEVANLIDYIWLNRKNPSKIAIKKVQESNEFQQCKGIFKPQYASLLDEAVNDMICDLKDFENHEYIEHLGRIGYKDQDQISFLINYGYKTMWAYFLESERGKISKTVLNSEKVIGINCGEFSYAEIPHRFSIILGVSGTLKTLTESEKKIVSNEYNIRNMTYCPSVYGASNLVFNERQDIAIVKMSQFFNCINNNLNENLQTTKGQRAVIIFFKNYSWLMKFYEFDQFRQQDDCFILEESLTNEEKKSLILRATYKGRVTLATRKFGRGTDFICKDQDVLKNGGVHVIQTFLSEELSEEVQIKGRTSRQGDKGSYTMILLDEDLKSFNIDEKDITQSLSDHYPMLCKARNTLQNTLKTDDSSSLKEKKHQHELCWDIVQKAVNEKNNEFSTEIFKFLLKLNIGRAIVSGDKITKTLVLMDATGSMTAMLSKTKNAVNIMFEEASQILVQKNIDPKLFEIQFACYRNYSSGAQYLLQHSSWESNPTLLKQFMETISPRGGQGREAVEIGLAHANSEYYNSLGSPFQVFIIGDAPPNTREDVTEKRGDIANWVKTKFEVPTYWEEEVQKLSAKNVQVFTFYVNAGYAWEKEVLTKIATMTNAECKFLDVNNEKEGQAMLIDLFVSQILQKVGDINGGRGAELVAAFAAKPKSYRAA